MVDSDQEAQNRESSSHPAALGFLRLQLSNDLIVSHTLDKSIRKIHFLFGEVDVCLFTVCFSHLLIPIYFRLFLFMSILSILNFALDSADFPIINISPVEMSQNYASQ